jgi:hypothetical protein
LRENTLTHDGIFLYWRGVRSDGRTKTTSSI